jgi:hypothetical protein
MIELVLLLAAIGLIVALSTLRLAATDDPVTEIRRCAANPLYFVFHYCRIKNEKTRRFERFGLWQAQTESLKTLWTERFVVMLKARQLGATTLVVCFAVWLALFQPNSTILIFSKTQREAKDMLRRVKMTIRWLPIWLQPSGFVVDATQELELPNGSRFITFASRGPGGDSYTASLVIIDEADLIPNLNELLEGAEPTIAADGRMVLLSRANKKGTDAPNSPFKKIYRAAVKLENQFKPLFLPWFAKPDRTQAWYEEQRRSIESRTGSLDDLYAQYPATADEAMAPREDDRRFLAKHVLKIFEPGTPLPANVLPWKGFEGHLRVYKLPERGHSYVIGADVAEGNPNSDDSVACVVDRATQEQVCVLSAKLEPGELAHWLARLAEWYNNAAVLVERNNHGAHCLNTLRSVPAGVARRPRLLLGRDKKYGWWTDFTGKRLMYAQLADAIRCGSCLIVDQMTYDQLISLDVDEMNAPEGEHDDCAIAYALAVYACSTPEKRPEVQVLTYNRGGPAEAAPEAAGPVYEGVTWIESNEEWWAQRTRDGERIDLYGSRERSEAEHAAMAADRMLAAEGRVERPKDAIEAVVWERLRERGWING